MWKTFCHGQSSFKELDLEGFRQEIGVSKEFTFVIWPKVVEQLELIRRNPKYQGSFAGLASMAQIIKPENETDFIVDEKIWKPLKETMERCIRGKDSGKK